LKYPRPRPASLPQTIHVALAGGRSTRGRYRPPRACVNVPRVAATTVARSGT